MALDLTNECGDKDRDIILKTDQEPAIQFLVEDVCVCCEGRCEDGQGKLAEAQRGVE
jgi:hypothetical protein